MALTKKQLEEIISGLNAKLEAMERKLDALEGLPNTVKKLEELLESSYAENTVLKQDLDFKEKQLEFLQAKVNSLEQYNRSWSIRVNGMSLTSEEEKSVSVVKKRVYDNLLLPILRGALDSGDLEVIPPVDEVLENAHVLPAKNGAKPIIARFFVREVRGLVFKHKRDFAPRAEAESADRPGRYLFPFFEDLTKLTFTKMREIANHPEVVACWSTGGQLRYKTKDNITVKRVNNLFDPVEKIVK